MALGNIDIRRLQYSGAGLTVWVDKSASFTAAVGLNYDCTNGAGAGIFVTIPTGSAGDEILIRRSGLGAVLLVAGISGGVINANMTVNGYSVRALALAPGASVLFRRNATGWVADFRKIGMVVSTNLLQFITAQTGYTTVASTANDTWADQSGNAYNFASNASATDPTYSATSGGESNHPAVSASAASYMDSTDGAQWNIDACTFICGAQFASRATVWLLNHYSTSVGWGFQMISTGKAAAQFQASLASDTGLRIGETYHVLSMIHTISQVNEVRFYQDSCGSSMQTCTGNAGDLSGPLRLWGSQSAANLFSGGYLGHALWSSVVTDQVREYGERFFKFSGIT